MSGGSIAASLTQALATATAPGGILTRKSTYVIGGGIVVGLAIVALILLATRAEPDLAAIRLTEPTFAKLPTRSSINIDEQTGRREIRSYGTLDHGDANSALIMTMPPLDQSMTRDFDQEIGELEPLRNTNVAVTGVFDLATRFGGYRAIEFNIDLEGRWKQCYAFLSRYESPAVYIKGWICEAVGKRTSADRVACLLDTVSFAPVPSVEADAFLQTRATRPSLCAARRLSDTERSRLRRR